MATIAPSRPQRVTGLPPGVEVGPLGSRLVAYLIDTLLPWVLGALLVLVLPGVSGAVRLVLGAVFVLAILAWALLVWRMTALRAASPGLRAMKLQVVGFYDGRPLGWGRTFARGLLLWLLSLTGIGLVLMVVLLVLHPRRQGWPDLAAKAVVIEQRSLAPRDVTDGAAAGGVPQPVAPAAYALTPAPGGRAEEAAEVSPQAPGGYHSPAYEVAAPVSTEADDTDPTLLPVTEPAGGWTAELDDGREIVVDGLVLLGRNPQPQPGEEDAQLVKLADETRTVSKSHLAIGVDTRGVFVIDQGSTNGSTVTSAAGESTRAPAGDVVYVADGTVISIGDHWLRIRRTT